MACRISLRNIGLCCTASANNVVEQPGRRPNPPFLRCTGCRPSQRRDNMCYMISGTNKHGDLTVVVTGEEAFVRSLAHDRASAVYMSVLVCGACVARTDLVWSANMIIGHCGTRNGRWRKQDNQKHAGVRTVISDCNDILNRPPIFYS